MAKESLTKKRVRIQTVLERLKKEFPDAHCELVHNSEFELLTATILSAQCTDKRVNIVTPALFARFPNAAAMAQGKLTEIETLIHSTGFYRNKAKSLKGMAEMVTLEYDGVIPYNLDKLVKLPGVGRKTANVLLGEYDVAVGVVVDTHVHRITRMLKLVSANDPVKIERELMKIVH
ncbi:MAG TPA: endonuclease III [Myxococcales bacterium]|nr:endonuclease III [Myxococcales bacterium]